MKRSIGYPVFVVLLLGMVSTTFQNCSRTEFTSVNKPSDKLDSDTQGFDVIIDDEGTFEQPEVEVPGTEVVEEDPDAEEVPPVVVEEEPAVVVELPTIGEYASIAFEDNVGSPSAGDRDYNDVVFNYKISENYNSLNQLYKIDIEVRIREKISGNNQRLFLYLNGDTGSEFSNISKKSAAAFQGTADIYLTNPNGEKIVVQNTSHIEVVPATKNNVGSVYNLEIHLNNPELNQVTEVAESIDFKKYRFILQNHGEDLGIDIAEINSTDEMVAKDGYPLGFMIPTDWQPPREGQLIDHMYSQFQLYRQWLNSDQSGEMSDAAATWFLQP